MNFNTRLLLQTVMLNMAAAAVTNIQEAFDAAAGTEITDFKVSDRYWLVMENKTVGDVEITGMKVVYAGDKTSKPTTEPIQAKKRQNPRNLINGTIAMLSGKKDGLANGVTDEMHNFMLGTVPTDEFDVKRTELLEQIKKQNDDIVWILLGAILQIH
ncbi:hypothetical protein ECANGB1_268 [Enterospora canceri]|uniref:Uncharacterized protein n=1 Tax=Enterospora canceri TaxID=1081671 RepID=A0A1Y1S4J0_9MICR|nr:hypothetical protein ECANGB1_268 [Enterospora canceri]